MCWCWWLDAGWLDAGWLDAGCWILKLCLVDVVMGCRGYVMELESQSFD
jgi:hypothetical protein